MKLAACRDAGVQGSGRVSLVGLVISKSVTGVGVKAVLNCSIGNWWLYCSRGIEKVGHKIKS